MFMRLIEILRRFEGFNNIVIYGRDDDTPIFDGLALNVPWYVAEYDIDDDIEEPMHTCIKDKANSALVVSVKEE